MEMIECNVVLKRGYKLSIFYVFTHKQDMAFADQYYKSKIRECVYLSEAKNRIKWTKSVESHILTVLL